MRHKIKTIDELACVVEDLHNSGKTVVFTNGCFDIIHYGHIKYLQDAKDKGDVLIVAVNSDSSVKTIKGKNRPINSQNDRAMVLAGLESIDFIIFFDDIDPLKTIKEIKPDVLIKGSDWEIDKIVGKDFVESYGGSVQTIKYERGYSTTEIIDKIRSLPE